MTSRAGRRTGAPSRCSTRARDRSTAPLYGATVEWEGDGPAPFRRRSRFRDAAPRSAQMPISRASANRAPSHNLDVPPRILPAAASPDERAILMTRSVHFAVPAVVAAAGLALGLLAAPAPGFAQMSQSDMVVRLDQLEGDVRRLTGAVEELQFRNQQLEQALRQLQGGGAQGAASPRPGPAAAPAAPATPAPLPNRRSDVFDPAQNPNAPGAPRVLGSPAAVAGGPISEPPAPIPQGPGGGDQVGAPLDLGTNPNAP